MRVAFGTVLADGHGGRQNLSEWLQAFPHRGEFMGVAPTGKQVETSGVGIDRFSRGKIAELWEHYDALSMLQQLGIIPSPEEQDQD